MAEIVDINKQLSKLNTNGATQKLAPNVEAKHCSGKTWFHRVLIGCWYSLISTLFPGIIIYGTFNFYGSILVSKHSYYLTILFC